MENPYVTALMNTSKLSDVEFLQEAIGSGNINPNILQQTPPTVLEVASRSRKGITPLGVGANLSKTFTVSPKLPKFVPGPRYPGFQPNRIESEGELYQLYDRIPIAAFTRGNHSSVSFGSLTNKQEIANNLYLHSLILASARSQTNFHFSRIVVEEGIYSLSDVSTLTEEELGSLSSKGRAIAYTVKNTNGEYSNLKTYQLAKYLMGYPFYDKIILDYHTFISDQIMARVFVVTPDMTNYQSLSPKRELETRFNGRVQSASLMLFDTTVHER